MSAESLPEIVTAAILVIGDEILSGRTKDKNIGFIADHLTAIGIDLREARVVPDVEEEIVTALNALRARYTHVFTTGGIGPTHDDITADAVGRAFGLSVEVNPEAVAMLRERIPEQDLNEARLRMARTPKGATLIANQLTKAPGFSIGNVHVMAGVPSIMHAMLEALTPRLSTGRKIHTRSIVAGVKEGDFAAGLGALQKRFPDVAMGSYPSLLEGGGFTTTLVLRSRDEARLDEAAVAVEAMLVELRASVG